MQPQHGVVTHQQDSNQSMTGPTCSWRARCFVSHTPAGNHRCTSCLYAGQLGGRLWAKEDRQKVRSKDRLCPTAGLLLSRIISKTAVKPAACTAVVVQTELQQLSLHKSCPCKLVAVLHHLEDYGETCSVHSSGCLNRVTDVVRA